MLAEQATLFGGPLRASPVAPRVIELRPYQRGAIEQVDALRAPGERVLVVAPTGAGKTVIASQLIVDELARGGTVLFIAHRTELIAQTYGTLLARGIPERDLGVVMGDGFITHPVTGERVCCRRPLARVQIASIDTLRNRPKPRATLVIVDECHRALARSYRDVAEAYPEALHVGLTATPYRADGRGLGDAYRRLIVVATPRQLMDEGFLAEPRCFSHPTKPDLKGVKTTAGEYDQAALGEAMDKRELVGNIVEHWARLAEGRRTAVFATNVAHSRSIVDAFRAAGVAAEHLDGETPSVDRAAILRRVDAGETRVVSNVMVLTEGWDQPSVKCIVLAAPTKSRAKYIQQKGRGVRPWEGVVPVVLDHAGNILEHGLLQDDFEISLEGRKKRAKQTVSTKECPGCTAVCAINAATCWCCSQPFSDAATDPSEGKPLVEKDGQLVEVRPGEARRKPTGEERDLRSYIHKLTTETDERQRWQPGTTNGKLFRRYGKGRGDMTLQELRAVAAYLEARTWDAPPVLHFEVPTRSGTVAA
jgi:superfamily II DNA or RNA helicase